MKRALHFRIKKKDTKQVKDALSKLPVEHYIVSENSYSVVQVTYLCPAIIPRIMDIQKDYEIII